MGFRTLAFFAAAVLAMQGAAPQPVRAPKAMVSSASAPATDAGVSILKQGGNAVDAAIENNTIAPGKRPISSQTPAIAARDGKLAFVLGTPGGTTIPNTVLQVVLNLIDHGMNIQEAVDAPRIHHQWLPDVIRYEKYGLAADVVRALEQRGHKLEVNGIGMVHAVQIEPSAGVRLGASDSRSADGKSAGY
jgi:gamma-glutamyltranspeptidase